MSVSFLGMALSIVAFTLIGCGFTPLYRAGTNTYNLKIATMPDHEGQMLKNELLALFTSQANNPCSYTLKPRIVFSHDEHGLRRDATAKRQTLTATIYFSLVKEASHKVIYEDKVITTTGYNVGSSAEVASVPLIASEKDARKRLMQQGAQEIKILIESFLATDKL